MNPEYEYCLPAHLQLAVLAQPGDLSVEVTSTSGLSATRATAPGGTVVMHMAAYTVSSHLSGPESPSGGLSVRRNTRAVAPCPESEDQQSCEQEILTPSTRGNAYADRKAPSQCTTSSDGEADINHSEELVIERRHPGAPQPQPHDAGTSGEPAPMLPGRARTAEQEICVHATEAQDGFEVSSDAACMLPAT